MKLYGKGVSGGIAIGKISFYKGDEVCAKPGHIEDTAAEMKRFKEVKEFTRSQLKLLYEKALKEAGEESAQIFDIHQMMLEDIDYNESIENFIKLQHLNAEYAVALTADNFAEMFSAMDDDYMQGRAADVKDVSNRLMKNLMNQMEGAHTSEGKNIICANDLAPSETVQLDKAKVLAFGTVYGSSNSHTAILARTMNIPAIVDLGEALSQELDGKEAIIDGTAGILYIEPDEETKAVMEKKYQEEKHKKELLQSLKGRENITPDGQKIDVFANIGSLEDMAAVAANDAGGIGLFRSEFLYLERDDYPSEEMQFQYYKKVLKKMSGKKVIIRTLDIGADKKVDYFGLDKEENPALGYRAIRICLTRPEVFKTQLRALYRASVFGNLGIMFPMIISLEEIREIKKIIQQVQEELEKEAIPFNPHVEIGIMIETPAAVMISDLLAREVDFFSVGTNDLTQYTLAIDRQNPRLEQFCNTHHQGILRMIKFAADNAHKCGAWIGICGELGGDLELTETFLAMGIDELSVPPGLILPLRDKIRKTSTKNREEILKKFDIFFF